MKKAVVTKCKHEIRYKKKERSPNGYWRVKAICVRCMRTLSVSAWYPPEKDRE